MRVKLGIGTEPSNSTLMDVTAKTINARAARASSSPEI